MYMQHMISDVFSLAEHEFGVRIAPWSFNFQQHAGESSEKLQFFLMIDLIDG